MGEADITEKSLESYDDVFSDIINVLLFDGRQLVREEELSDAAPLSAYKDSDGRMHEQERDVAKYWRNGSIRICLYGLENGIAMCEVLDKVERRGFELGQREGFASGQREGFASGQREGFASGQNTILALANRLIASGRIDDLSRASTDSEYLARLLKEEGLQPDD